MTAKTMIFLLIPLWITVLPFVRSTTSEGVRCVRREEKPCSWYCEGLGEVDFQANNFRGIRWVRPCSYRWTHRTIYIPSHTLSPFPPVMSLLSPLPPPTQQPKMCRRECLHCRPMWQSPLSRADWCHGKLKLVLCRSSPRVVTFVLVSISWVECSMVTANANWTSLIAYVIGSMIMIIRLQLVIPEVCRRSFVFYGCFRFFSLIRTLHTAIAHMIPVLLCGLSHTFHTPSEFTRDSAVPIPIMWVIAVCK